MTLDLLHYYNCNNVQLHTSQKGAGLQKEHQAVG